MSNELVSIKRKNIDGNKIQGFVLAESSNLILLNYVYDFNLDGLMVLRKSDISSIESTETDKFQTELLKNEGVYSKVNFDVDYDLTSWGTFVSSAIVNHQYLILEKEAQEVADFIIGKIVEIKDDFIVLKYFTGIGRWLDDLEEHEYADITCCQIGNNYLNVYERFFKQQGA